MVILATFRVTAEEYPKCEFQCPNFQKWFLRSILPTVICTYCSIVLNNASLLYIGAGLNAMISLATPVVTALVAAFFGLEIAKLAWLGILLTVGGDGIITLDGFDLAVTEGTGVHLFLVGLALALLSLGVRGVKTVLQDKLMNRYSTSEEEHPQLTPLGSWYLQLPLLLCFGVAGSFAKEGYAPWRELPNALASPLLYQFILSLGSASVLNVSGMYVIKMLGAPAAQIASQFNTIVVAALSCAFLGETFTVRQGAATVLILIGVHIYEEAQNKKVKDLSGLLHAVSDKMYGSTGVNQP
jgi:drug/metabolite transporter (DMT)-like permease